MGRFSIGSRVRDPNGNICEVIGKPKKGVREIRFMGGYLDGAVYWADKSTLTSANDNADSFPRAEISETAYDATTPAWTSGQWVNTSNGDTAVVDGDVDAEGHVWVRYTTGQRSRLPASWLTAWVPKVGDRVRMSKPTGIGEFTTVPGSIRSKNACFEGSFLVEFDEYVGFGHNGNGIGDVVLTSGRGWFIDAESLQPVVAPATTALQIEAGKFYRTRDGRKVGPMELWVGMEAFPDGGELYHAPADADHNGEYWRATGENADGHVTPSLPLDLVAEWVEPEPAVAVAEATATPFKKGDRLLCVNADGTTIVKVGETYVASEDQDGEFVDMPQGMYANRFVLAPEPAAPPAKFKVGDRVVIVSSPYGSDDAVAGCYGTISAKSVDGFRGDWVVDLRDRWSLGFQHAELAHAPAAPTIPIGSTVTFTATGRLSAVNENGHAQIVFPGLTPGQNSFALPSKFVSLAN